VLERDPSGRALRRVKIWGYPMTCRSRSSRRGIAAIVLLAGLPAAAVAADLPPIRTSDSNPVAACATPGRLMAYLRDRNPKLAPKFEEVAADYMRHGAALGVRWDYAFFQMLLETGYLTYTGDVKPEQNNFAGLGATGGGVRGESFKDVSTGTRAHLEHLLMYSGEHVENPVAQRTRNVQEWGVLTDWQKRTAHPITFTQLAKQWAPGSKRYAADLSAIADRFFQGICQQPDPQPELIAAAGGAGASETGDRRSAGAEKIAAADPATSPGVEAQRRSVEASKADGTARSQLGAPGAQTARLPVQSAAAKAVAAAGTDDTTISTASTTPPVTLLNPSTSSAPPASEATPKGTADLAGEPVAGASKAGDTPKVAAETPKVSIDGAKKSSQSLKAKTSADLEKTVAANADAPASTAKDGKGSKAAGKTIEVAALPGPLKDAGKVEKKEAASAAPTPKCRVWTASYGGSKAIIIKAVTDKTVNYTVLDVNEGTEKREADAYINAYAKGGQQVGVFQSQPQALEKAFELCPEG